MREGSVTVSLAPGGSLIWRGSAKPWGQLPQAGPDHLGISASVYAMPLRPFWPPQLFLKLLLALQLSVTLHLVHWDVFPVPPLKPQGSIFIHSCVSSFIHCTCVLVFIKHPLGYKPCVVCWGSEAIKTHINRASLCHRTYATASLLSNVSYLLGTQKAFSDYLVNNEALHDN